MNNQAHICSTKMCIWMMVFMLVLKSTLTVISAEDITTAGTCTKGKDEDDASCTSDIPSVKVTNIPQWLQDGEKQLTNFAQTNKEQDLLVGLEKDLYAWKNVPLNIAVVGQSGKGKSSLINAMLGLNAYEKGAVKVGVTETTFECTSYKHPKDKNVKMWDCPGAGTKKFPLKSYLKMIEVEKYDFVFLCTSERLNEIDIQLGKKLQKSEKHFYWIRTKVDQDIRNMKMAWKDRGTFNENIVLYKIKKEALGQLNANFKSNSVHLFLISSFYVNRYDFPALQERLIEDISFEKKRLMADISLEKKRLIADISLKKKEKMIFTVKPYSVKIIEAKYQQLKSNIWKIAALAALGSLVPIPGLSVAFDAGLIAKETIHYREQFGLDEENLNKLAIEMGQSREQIVNGASLKTVALVLTAAGVVALAAKYCPQYALKTAAAVATGVIFVNILFSGYSFYLIGLLLNEILSMMKSDAIRLHKYIQEQIV